MTRVQDVVVTAPLRRKTSAFSPNKRVGQTLLIVCLFVCCRLLFVARLLVVCREAGMSHKSAAAYIVQLDALDCVTCHMTSCS